MLYWLSPAFRTLNTDTSLEAQGNKCGEGFENDSRSLVTESVLTRGVDGDITPKRLRESNLGYQ